MESNLSAAIAAARAEGIDKTEVIERLNILWEVDHE
jgi:hypothetical protein